eukprot:GHVR01093270.1.p1 GENE.GHVR01093270.1~~GHVR01093270.1.p1  ORF type:complete len:169 (+),score=54.33 GHVR01093270.1:95-601(+)
MDYHPLHTHTHTHTHTHIPSESELIDTMCHLGSVCRWLAVQYVRKQVRSAEYRQSLGPPPSLDDTFSAQTLPLQALVQMETERELTSLGPLVENVMLGSMQTLPHPTLSGGRTLALYHCLSELLFRVLTELVLAESKFIRKTVHQLMLSRVLPMLTSGRVHILDIPQK